MFLEIYEYSWFLSIERESSYHIMEHFNAAIDLRTVLLPLIYLWH